MSTVIGAAGVPVTAMIAPVVLRITGAFAAIRPRGTMRTRSAPAPLIVRFLSTVIELIAFVPLVLAPSTYVPGQMATVSPAVAAVTALWMEVKPAAGQS